MTWNGEGEGGTRINIRLTEGDVLHSDCDLAILSNVHSLRGGAGWTRPQLLTLTRASCGTHTMSCAGRGARARGNGLRERGLLEVLEQRRATNAK